MKVTAIIKKMDFFVSLSRNFSVPQLYPGDLTGFSPVANLTT